MKQNCLSPISTQLPVKSHLSYSDPSVLIQNWSELLFLVCTRSLWVPLPTRKLDSSDINVCILAMSTFSVPMSDLTKLLPWSILQPLGLLLVRNTSIRKIRRCILWYTDQMALTCHILPIYLYLWRRKSPFFLKILSSEWIKWSLYDDSMPENTEFLYE